ncbi:putative methyltransferase DDB_G0268948 isoform X2 [Eleutherodactylus coqui]|uniref:putative methyltransferase DDB_G0268948 isoform X2 n=1 Tax=Eleutherodactylus coqui TaxID=57060 RepID=UPI0034618D52
MNFICVEGNYFVCHHLPRRRRSSKFTNLQGITMSKLHALAGASSIFKTGKVFKNQTFSSTYYKYMIPVSEEIINMVLSFVQVKRNAQPLEMAVDVGCGTGRYTIPLAPHFRKVLGIDISESQINLANQYNLLDNVSYMVAPAEKLPIENDSVDLVNVGLAAHWFKVDKFAGEAARVLKKKGCFALHGFHPSNEIEYKDLSHDLTVVMSEIWNFLHPYADKNIEDMYCQYKNIYEAVPLKDKQWITDIPVKFHMSIAEIMGFIQSVCMFQIFLEKDVKGAEQFLKQTEKRFQEILGEKADSVQLNVQMKHYCVLACKD